jgi:hypothetical protein
MFSHVIGLVLFSPNSIINYLNEFLSCIVLTMYKFMYVRHVYNQKITMTCLRIRFAALRLYICSKRPDRVRHVTLDIQNFLPSIYIEPLKFLSKPILILANSLSNGWQLS